jgi:hypothetical protein
VSSNSLPSLPASDIKAEPKLAQESVPKKEIVMPETVEDQISYYTQKAGDLSRQLGLAGIAVIWLFKISNQQVNASTQVLLPESLHLPLILIVVSLALDSFQYLLGIVIWGYIVAVKKGLKNPGTDYTGRVIFLIIIVGLKVLIMFVAYVILLHALKGITGLWSSV